jgi:hypothetical protein
MQLLKMLAIYFSCPAKKIRVAIDKINTQE